MMTFVLKNPYPQLRIELPQAISTAYVSLKTRPINNFSPVHVPLPNI